MQNLAQILQVVYEISHVKISNNYRCLIIFESFETTP